MSHLNNKELREQHRQRPAVMVMEYLLIFIALLPFAMIVNWVFVPHNVVGGGLTGICSIIYYATEGLAPTLFPAYGGSIPIWLSTLTINFLLLIMAVLTVGWQFCIRTAFGCLCLSFWYRVIPMRPEPLIDDPLVACIVGGVLFGLCLGVVMLNNGSSGGTDIVAMVVHHYKPSVSLARVMVLCDVTIILCSWFLPIPASILPMVHSVTDYKIHRIFCCICMTVSYTFALDWLVMRVGQSVQMMIFSRRYSEIATAINTTVNRGVTVLDGTGWYSQKPVHVVTVLARKSEARTIYALIRQIDPEAFVSQADVSGVYGTGFDDIRGN